jgi:hypothetical protein
MYAAGEMMAALAAFLPVALVPTLLALWFLRDHRRVWTAVALASLAFAFAGLAGVLMPHLRHDGATTMATPLLALLGLAQLLLGQHRRARTSRRVRGLAARLHGWSGPGGPDPPSDRSSVNDRDARDGPEDVHLARDRSKEPNGLFYEERHVSEDEDREDDLHWAREAWASPKYRKRNGTEDQEEKDQDPRWTVIPLGARPWGNHGIHTAPRGVNAPGRMWSDDAGRVWRKSASCGKPDGRRQRASVLKSVARFFSGATHSSPSIRATSLLFRRTTTVGKPVTCISSIMGSLPSCGTP